MAKTWKQGDDQGRILALKEAREQAKKGNKEMVMVVDGLTGKKRMLDLNAVSRNN